MRMASIGLTSVMAAVVSAGVWTAMEKRGLGLVSTAQLTVVRGGASFDTSDILGEKVK